MMMRLNYFNNMLNLFLIFIYFILINIKLVNKEFEYFLIFLIIINLLIKLYNWYNFNISKKQHLNIIINKIFFNDRYLKLNILIFSIITPAYMIFQKENLVIDLFIVKLSFLLVFIFSIVGFYLEFFVLESKIEK
tara:strand:- start:1012 stop:1416 length:405 start_codon:yes stop_codon:yes gene_type:complete